MPLLFADPSLPVASLGIRDKDQRIETATISSGGLADI
jgi:hypothetical protein